MGAALPSAWEASSSSVCLSYAPPPRAALVQRAWAAWASEASEASRAFVASATCGKRVIGVTVGQKSTPYTCCTQRRQGAQDTLTVVTPPDGFAPESDMDREPMASAPRVFPLNLHNMLL